MLRNYQQAMLLLFTLLSCYPLQAAEKRPLTLPDIMQFREIEQVSISDNGHWLSYVQKPDRGDNSGHVLALNDTKKYRIPLAGKAKLNNNGSWAGFLLNAPLLKVEQAEKKQREQLKTDGLLLNTATGEQKRYSRVKSIGFSGDNQFALLHFYPLETSKNNDSAKEQAANSPAQQQLDHADDKHYLQDKMLGSQALLVDLKHNTETKIAHIQSYTFASDGPGLAYVITDKNGVNNQLVFFDTQQRHSTIVSKQRLAAYPHMALSKTGNKLAFLQGSYQEQEKSRHHQLMTYSYGDSRSKTANISRPGWFISHDNNLRWSDDEQRLFFAEKPRQKSQQAADSAITTQQDLFNSNKITAQNTLLVWHGDDPWIKPHEAKQYKNEQQRCYLSLYYPKEERYLPLADEQVRHANISQNSQAIVLSTDMPYRKELTWAGSYSDFYHLSLQTGQRQLIEKRMDSDTDIKISPSGRYASYYHQGAIWLFDSHNASKHNLTASIATPFADELHDYPAPAPGYGIAGWLEQDKGVLVYDRYDIWLFSPNGKGQNLTQGDGRKRQVEYRIVNTDQTQSFFHADDTLLLSAYYDKLKHFGFYQLDLNKPATPVKLLEDKKKYTFIGKAKHADTLIYTREDMAEFPDLWQTNNAFADNRKLTTVNPQISEFLWGKPELINWRSSKGKALQGILIKPANYQVGQRYPVLVYYYRYFSQRMYAFNQMKVNHRPNFPYYSGNGYAVFLPDIKFDIGTPGASATDALVPGIQKIVDMGIADENAIGLHGHSWSGYQTAFAITQTDIFKAAVAGAPVANMTSAYSGIRLGSGLARQFQYEQTQSRIGGSLFDKLELYIENSPVFYADRVNTPLLIQFGDRDDAVPWQQGIELYLALRRLNKPVIMLQYQDEPHHLKKYANKVDYSLKMREFFDHHLKGKTAPTWMTEGIPYHENTQTKH